MYVPLPVPKSHQIQIENVNVVIVYPILDDRYENNAFFSFSEWSRSLFIGGNNLLSPRKSIKDKTGKNVVFVDGVRTPFLLSGTDYSKFMAYDLAQQSLV